MFPRWPAEDGQLGPKMALEKWPSSVAASVVVDGLLHAVHLWRSRSPRFLEDGQFKAKVARERWPPSPAGIGDCR